MRERVKRTRRWSSAFRLFPARNTLKRERQRLAHHGSCFTFEVSRITFHVSFLACCVCAFAADVDTSKLPPPATNRVEFARDIKPIFQQSCLKCHGPEKPKSKFRLDNRESALKGGNNGVDIIPGDSAKSPLIHNVAGLVEDMEMPPKGKAEPLTPEQIGWLRAWIDQGAVWETQPPESLFSLSLSPTVGWTTVSGNEHKFREHYWMKEGWNGGAENFLLTDKVGKESKLTMEGHALVDDYRVVLTLEKNEVGFTRFGWEQYRKYFDDTGGYFRDFTPSAFSLDRDLHLDVGRAWAEFGLTLPDWPRMVLGYEYQYRDGEKSTLQWGKVDQGGEPKNIFPNTKLIDERTHIIKFDLDYELKGVRIEDRFRGEFGELNTERRNVVSYTIGNPAPTQVDVAREKYQHFDGANTFRVERQFNDWLYGSLGYLYSKLNADETFDLNPVLLPPGAFAYRWSANNVLEQESHVLNLSGQLGPFDGLTISGGVLSEWTRQTGLGNGNLGAVASPGDPLNPAANATFDRNLDKGVVEEKVAVRYAKIPFTVLFAEARLQQESLGENQQQVGGEFGGSLGFLRRTDVTGDLRDFRAGFSTSPWRWASLTAHYRHYEKETDYDHSIDEFLFADPPPPGQGYPAFIRSLDRETDEVETKLALHPVSWWRTTLSYKMTATDYEAATDAAPKSSGSISPGGPIQSRNYDAQVFSANLTLTPWRRLYLSTTFSYQQTRTLTAQNGSPSVVPFKGDIYTVLASANFALNAKTGLRATYSFSLADYGQDNSAEGLPMGINYQQHGMRVGLTRRINKNFTAALQYGFYLYDEPSGGRLNNYTAHAVFGTLSLALP